MRLAIVLALAGLAAGAARSDKYEWRSEGKEPATRALYRALGKAPLLMAHFPEKGRFYVHPIAAPDGRGILTEYSPAHHKHQTGLFVGFLKVNGRDYFHNRGEDYFRRRRMGSGTLSTTGKSPNFADFEAVYG